MKTFPPGESNLGQYVENEQKTRHHRVVTGLFRPHIVVGQALSCV